MSSADLRTSGSAARAGGLLLARTAAPAMLLLLLFVLLAGDTSRRKSATFDEGNHLTRGLYPLSGQGFRLNEDHPPLVNLLQALPVWLTMAPQVPRPRELVYPFFSYSDQVLWRSGNDGPAMIQVARLVTVGIGAALGLLIFWWARSLYGPWGALLSLSAYVLWPEVLAHGGLVTTDMGHAAGLFLFAFALWRLLQAPSWRRTLFAGLCLGLALGTKHTTLLLIPGSLLVLIWVQWTGGSGLSGALGPVGARLGEGHRTRRLLTALMVWSALLLAAGVVIWGLYGFTVGPLREHPWTVPAPDYIQGILHRAASLKMNRWFFLNGEVSREGFYSFFPLAFLYKTPLPLLALLLLNVAYRVTGRLRGGGRAGLALDLARHLPGGVTAQPYEPRTALPFALHSFPLSMARRPRRDRAAFTQAQLGPGGADPAARRGHPGGPPGPPLLLQPGDPCR